MPTRGFIAALAVVGLAGCGGGASPRDAVRATVTRFAEASAKKDYQTLCDALLAPALVKNVEQYGLPCELALKQGLGDVRDPRLMLGTITVNGDRASARITTAATGQASSTDTLALRRIGGAWRIAALS